MSGRAFSVKHLFHEAGDAVGTGTALNVAGLSRWARSTPTMRDWPRPTG